MLNANYLQNRDTNSLGDSLAWGLLGAIIATLCVLPFASSAKHVIISAFIGDVVFAIYGAWRSIR